MAGPGRRAARRAVEHGIRPAGARRVLRSGGYGKAAPRPRRRSPARRESRRHEGAQLSPQASQGTVMMQNVDLISWLATAVFLVSYFTKGPRGLRRVRSEERRVGKEG